jgi:hypothetical protein
MLVSFLTFFLLLITITSANPLSPRNVITWPPQIACQDLPASAKSMSQYEGRQEDLYKFIDYANCVMASDWEWTKQQQCHKQWATFPYSCIWARFLFLTFSSRLQCDWRYLDKHWDLRRRGIWWAELDADVPREKMHWCISFLPSFLSPSSFLRTLEAFNNSNAVVRSWRSEATEVHSEGKFAYSAWPGRGWESIRWCEWYHSNTISFARHLRRRTLLGRLRRIHAPSRMPRYCEQRLEDGCLVLWSWVSGRSRSFSYSYSYY